jgi:hypothetical protein
MIENPNDMKEVYFMRYNVIGFRCTSTHATLAGLKEKLAEVRRKKGNVLCVAKFVKVPFDLSEVDGDSLTEGQDKPIPANWMYEKAGKIKEISAKRPVDVIYAELVTQIS